jgi:hypothetical protein
MSLSLFATGGPVGGCDFDLSFSSIAFTLSATFFPFGGAGFFAGGFGTSLSTGLTSSSFGAGFFFIFGTSLSTGLTSSSFGAAFLAEDIFWYLDLIFLLNSLSLHNKSIYTSHSNIKKTWTLG